MINDSSAAPRSPTPHPSLATAVARGAFRRRPVLTDSTPVPHHRGRAGRPPQAFDWSSAPPGVHLVASVPGTFSGADLHSFGHMRIRALLGAAYGTGGGGARGGGAAAAAATAAAADDPFASTRIEMAVSSLGAITHNWCADWFCGARARPSGGSASWSGRPILTDASHTVLSTYVGSAS